MYKLTKIGKLFSEKVCWAPGPRLIKNIIYRAEVSQSLRNTGLGQCEAIGLH
jgi:hypothetical protein